MTLTSATKQMAGHADLLLGYVTTRDTGLAQSLRDWRRDAGSIPGPFEAWLAHRSLPTLALRIERGSENALALARLLAARDDVPAVAYPGLPGDPGHDVARRQMRGYGAVVSFDLGSEERAERFLAGARLISDATSFGSVHHGRAQGPLGRRQSSARLHPPVGGVRGHGRSAGGRGARPRPG